MVDTKSSSRTHPLVVGAAVSVMLVSLTGVAAMMGLLPKSHSSAAPAATTAVQPAAQVAQAQTVSAPLPSALVDDATSKSVTNRSNDDKPAVKQRSSSSSTSTSPYARPAQPPVAQVAKVCDNCGRIESVNAIQQEAKPSGIGIAAGAVLGGVLGNQIGGGNGRKVATVAGAVGGGFAGNEIEKRTRATTSYEIHVRMEDGQVRTFPYAEQPGWNIGDRVRVVNGQLTSRT